MTLQGSIRSAMMAVLSSKRLAAFQQGKARYLRHFRVESPRVYYFHQAGDPYSHLAVQKFSELKRRYDLNFVALLVHPPADQFKGDAAKFETWAEVDAASVAGYFGTEFKPTKRPSIEAVAVANGLLANVVTHDDFAIQATQIGEALWADELRGQKPQHSGAQLNKGTQMRKRLGHYLGGMFYFEGEWFWGLDRLHLLERRLQAEGYGSGELVCPLPQVADFVSPNRPQETGPNAAAQSDIVLEYFPSLRSPYTAIGHQRVLDLVEQTGVTLQLRPVMPMMMRGVPAPLAKQLYIMSDAGREARFYSVDFGPFCDPLGEPVKRAFAAYHYADQQQLGLKFVTEYLAASFAEGLNIREQEGLTEVCRRAGFDLNQVDPAADWQAGLAANLEAMAEGSLWGVPSFRVTDGSNPQPFSCWGQDRIWRVAAEIRDRSVGFDNDQPNQQGAPI